MSQVIIQMDDELKVKADKVLKDMGLNMTTAVTMFLKAVIRERRIPFEIDSQLDPFLMGLTWNRLLASFRKQKRVSSFTKP
jgi:addiction module RelB/DinJ family antitoxin